MPQRRYVTDEQIAEWRELRSKGLSYEDIAKNYPFHFNTIRTYISDYPGLRENKNKCQRELYRRNNPERIRHHEKLRKIKRGIKVRKLRKEGYTIQQIAVMLDIGVSTVRRHYDPITRAGDKRRYNKRLERIRDDREQAAIISNEELANEEIDEIIELGDDYGKE